jgi:Domain of unknown function (DUF4334)/GXWXG protein
VRARDRPASVAVVQGTTDDALARFDGCPPAGLAELTGRWRGSGLPTGHPLDGLLERFGWWGKEIVDPETVHPLLFRDAAGRPRPLSPAFAPLGLLRRYPAVARLPGTRAAFATVRPLLRTGQPAARLRQVEHRGVVTAALVYDRLPVVDVFRRLSEDTLLGLMDLRGMPRPFFFLLHRDPG